MTKRTNTTKTTIYRRHAPTCPIHDQPLNLANCECPLWIHGRVAGKFIRKSLDTRKLSTAELRQSDLENNRTAGDAPLAIAPRVTPDGGVPLAYAASEFLAGKTNKASNTLTLYKRAVNHFLDWADKQEFTLLAHIDLPQVRQYFRECGKNWKRSTSQGRLTHLRVWFNYCLHTRRWIQFSPAAARDLNFARAKGKSATTKQRMPFAPDEITRILAAVERMPVATRDRARALVYLLLYTGMRISDATFFERAFLTASHTAKYYVIKTRKLIATPPEVQHPALDALAKLPQSRVYFFQSDRDDDYAEARQALRDEDNGEEFSLLMPNYTKRIAFATRLVLRVLQIAGISGACHRFRDTFAVTMLMGGTDIYTVSKMLGHSDVKITDAHYMKFLPGHAEMMSQKTRCLAYQHPLAVAVATATAA